MTQPESLIGPAHLEGLEGLARKTPAGTLVEVGVFKGGSAWYLNKVAQERGDELHLFDTFTGIPFADPDDSDPAGGFAETSAEDVQRALPTAILHVGIFPATMPDSIKSVSFVHSDCDQYRSVRAVIDVFWPMLVPGGIMAFDDMNTNGGQKAIKEAFGEEIEQEEGWWRVRKPA